MENNTTVPATSAASVPSSSPQPLAADYGIYHAERMAIEKKAWDRRIPYAVGACLIVALLFLLCFRVEEKPIATDKQLDSHRVLVMMASSAHKAMEQVFEYERIAEVRRNRGQQILEDLTKKGEKSMQEADRTFEKHSRTVEAETKTFDDALAQPILRERTLDPALEPIYVENMQDYLFYDALAKDTRKYMELGFGKKSFDGAAMKKKLDLFACSHVIIQKYPGGLCIENPTNPAITNMLTGWFGNTDQKEGVDQVCERFFNETYTDLFERLKKASAFHVFAKSEVKCPSVFEINPVEVDQKKAKIPAANVPEANTIEAKAKKV